MALAKLLIVDPESKWTHLLHQILTGAGYGVLAAGGGGRALQVIAEEQPALVLTESVLGADMTGFEFVRRLREFSDLPVIFLSLAADTEDVLRGFEAGADDYIPKPYDARILLARTRALLKRCTKETAAPAVIQCRSLIIDQTSRQVTSDGMPVYLTEKEYDLLLELARHQNQVMLHEQLLMAVWGREFRDEVNYLRSYIHMLRRKLETNPSQPRLILNCPGIGYKLVSEPSEISGE